jgi:signal transduction histidine kinase
MLALQALGATTFFLQLFLSRALGQERLLAVYLGFLVLVAAGFVASSPRVRVPLIAAKAALCLLCLPYTGLPLILVPAVGFELAELLRAAASPPSPPWLAYSLALGAFGLLVEKGGAVMYAGAWAVSALFAWGRLADSAARDRLAARARELERRATEAEEKSASLARAGQSRELFGAYRERDRLAQELHDGLGHALTGGIMQLEAAALLVPGEPERAGAMLAKVRSSLKEGLASVRASLAALKPEPARLGLLALREALEAFGADQGVEVRLATEGDLNAIGPEIWEAAEANLREALTNSLRHSGGAAFTCGIRVLNRLIKVEFRDEGAPSGEPRKGMGLEGMEARTRKAGGTLILDGSRGFSAIMLFERKE